MLSEVQVDGQPQRLGPLERPPHIAQAARLQHEMVNAERGRQVKQRERVVALVAMHECATDVDRAHLRLESLCHAEPQQSAIKRFHRGQVLRDQDDMPQSQRAGFKAIGKGGAGKGRRRFGKAHAQLHATLFGVVHMPEVLDLALAAKGGIALLGTVPGCLQALHQLAQFVLIGAFQAHGRQVVTGTWRHHKALAGAIHTPACAAVGMDGGRGKPEHVFHEPLPAGGFAGFKHQIGKAEGIRHGGMLLKLIKQLKIELNVQK